ncbi:unnamed protein product [Rotaria sp. Silwood1]|nr:unnamed protein product [Rotaria sp. Silwood1]CAF1209994.1 unnamed protein product [Rotaria sp. Silwood1]CAF3463728.1 unnamed protein product [Rotaria sp. Silwood1]CAF4837836.1 unnamed protein product [Rotaria sp. Silwood1]
MNDSYAVIGFLGLCFLSLFYTTSAYIIAQNLVAALEKAFRPTNNVKIASDKKISNEPFSVRKLFQTVPKVSFRTLTYVTYDDATLTLDFYTSTVSGKRPCVLVIHGGAWSAGDSKQLPELNSHLARAGYHCAAISYRLAPRWQCPAPIEDVAAALNYLCKHADDLNIDTNNFVLLGRSAGGQIALLAAYTLQQSGIKGAIDFYGPADMIYGYMVPTNPYVINSGQALARYIGGDYYQIPDKYAASSPIEFVNRQTVPTLIFHGLTDALVFCEHSRRLSAKLDQYDVPHYLLELPWGTHGFDYHLNGPGGQLSTFAIEYFLRVVTGGQ